MENLPKATSIGDSVIWYPHGDINQKPFAATVVDRINDECITLYTLSPTGRREPMLNVKHVMHPSHEGSPQGLKRWGAWDLIGTYEKRQEEIKKQNDEIREKSREEAEKNSHIVVNMFTEPDEDEMRIIKFSRELGDAPGRAQQVADKIGADMTHQRVNAVLRKYPHLLKGELPEELVETGK